MLLYRNILKQSLKISWGHKNLWFFGLFAALLGSSGGYEIIFRKINENSGQGFIPGFNFFSELGIFSGNFSLNLVKLFKSDPVSVIIVLLVFLIILALILFLLWLAVISQAALINNTVAIINGKSKKIKDGVLVGVKYFWPIIGLNIINKIIIYLGVALIGLPLILSASGYLAKGSDIIYVVLFTITVPLAIILSFVIKYAMAYAVIKNKDIISAIREGWFLFINNWLVSVEVALLLFFVNFILGLAVIIVILVLTIPFLFLALLLYKLVSISGFIFVGIIALLLFVGIIAISGAFITVFQISAWTGLFLELAKGQSISKISRLVEEWKK